VIVARRARMIIPGAPHHVTQRGNRREPIFLEPGDEALYLDLMSAAGTGNTGTGAIFPFCSGVLA